jgi:hypothetical protein
MLTEGEQQLRDNVKKILAAVTETNEMVREVKLWRKFIAWAFAFVTAALTLRDLWGYISRIFR